MAGPKISTDNDSDDDDQARRFAKEILQQIQEAPEVRGRDQICSEFGIMIDEFNQNSPANAAFASYRHLGGRAFDNSLTPVARIS